MAALYWIMIALALLGYWFLACCAVAIVVLIAFGYAYVVTKGVIRFLNFIGIKCR